MKRRFDTEFEAFIRAHRVSLVRFATVLSVGDVHLAEDLVQGALIRVYLAKPSQARDLLPYVRKALVNGLIDHKRRSVTRRELVTPTVPDHAAQPAAEPMDPELVMALAALPPRMRAAVVLRYVEGLSVEETAQVLDCTIGTVKSQAARGLDKLRREIAATEVEAYTCQVS